MLNNKQPQNINTEITEIKDTKRVENVKKGFILIYGILAASTLALAFLGYCFKLFSPIATSLTLLTNIVFILLALVAQKTLKKHTLIVIIISYTIMIAWDLWNHNFYWTITQGIPLLFALYYTIRNMTNLYTGNKLMKFYFSLLYIISSLACLAFYLYNEYLYCGKSFVNYINPFSYLIVLLQVLINPSFLLIATPLVISINYFLILEKEESI